AARTDVAGHERHARSSSGTEGGNAGLHASPRSRRKKSASDHDSFKDRPPQAGGAVHSDPLYRPGAALQRISCGTEGPGPGSSPHAEQSHANSLDFSEKAPTRSITVAPQGFDCLI